MNDINKLTRRGLLGTLAATSTVTLAACGDDAVPAGPNPDIIPLNNLLTKEYEAIKAYAAALPTLNMPPTRDPQAARAAWAAASEAPVARTVSRSARRTSLALLARRSTIRLP